MKYVVVIPDGAADVGLDALNGRTPLEAAHTPHLDALAAGGQLGTAGTTPAEMACGSDVCTMSLLGYDPARYHTGRAPLEAEALGIDMGPRDWVFRVNLITATQGEGGVAMRDHSAGHITSEEGAALLRACEPLMRELLPGAELFPGVSYRNILRDSSGERDWSDVRTVAPHDVPGEPMERVLPQGGEGSDVLRALVERSGELLSQHPVNIKRRTAGLGEATHLWPWGQGRRPDMPGFESRFGLRGAMITAVDLLAGIAGFIGWERLDVPGQTSYHDTDYQAAGHHGIAALSEYDIVCIHIESPDEASHAAEPETKVAAIEAIDEHVVGPLHAALRERGEAWGGWRMLVLPDHYTRCDTRKHDPTPVPFLLAGVGVEGVRGARLTEREAQAAGHHVAQGHELMDVFLDRG